MSDEPEAEEHAVDCERHKRPAAKPEGRPAKPIKPVAKRIGEAGGNLRRRGEWFRKRSQRSGDQS
jgi:hypothetical protein